MNFPITTELAILIDLVQIENGGEMYAAARTVRHAPLRHIIGTTGRTRDLHCGIREEYLEPRERQW